MKHFLALAAYAALCGSAYAQQTAPMNLNSPSPAYNWRGFYAGPNVSYGWARSNAPLNIGFGTVVDTSMSMSGIGVGGTAGYNWQVNRVVFGIEADTNWGNIKGSGSQNFSVLSFPGAVSTQASLGWYATVRARLGYALGSEQRLLPFVTAGYAAGRVSASGNASVLGFPVGSYSVSETKGGYVLGGGLEYKLSRSWSAKVEYLRIDLGNVGGTANTLFGPVAVSTRARADMVRLGVNFAF